ncbi:MAG: hypothetical protein ACLFVG_10095 [Candidatus Aminicenantes bacterium]
MKKRIYSIMGIVLLFSFLTASATESTSCPSFTQEKQPVEEEGIEETIQEALAAVKKGNRQEAIDLLAEAIMLLKNSGEFHIAKLFLCSEINDYRDYTPKNSNVLKAGEPLLLYIEPDGYRLLKEGNQYRIWVSLDASIADAQGEVIFERNNWVNYKKAFPTPIIPFYLTNRVSDIPAGKYTYTMTLKDHYKNTFLTKSFEFSVE